MKKKKRISVMLAGLAMLLPLGAGTGSAWAYFTDHVEAESGGYGVETGRPDTELEEGFGEWTKNVRVRNTGDIPVYVRLQAFCGSEYRLEYTEDENWKKSGDYYYYTGTDGILETGERTPALSIKILDKDGDPIPDQPEEFRARFNVVVIGEKLPLQYDAEGSPVPPEGADWTRYKLTAQGEGGDK